MGGGTKIAAVVVLLIVIIAAVSFMAKKWTGGVQPPDRVMDAKHEKIDMVDGTLMTKTFREWQKLGHDGGGWKYKNPDTGRYTMVDPILCPVCGAKIAPPDAPPHPRPDDKAAMKAYQEKMDELKKTYKCPKCGAHFLQ